MKRHQLHPLPLRIWHWVNTAVILLLMITGIQLRAPDVVLFSGYRTTIVIHKAVGFIMALEFLFWLVYSVANGSLRKQYLFRKSDMLGVTNQLLYYVFGVFRGRKNPFSATPEAKFNALQKMAYISVQFIFSPVIIATGILFGNIVLFRGVIDVIGGTKILDAIHVAAAYVFVIYLCVHVYMATLGAHPFSHTKAMFTGYEEEEE
jgi:thiosulfate reductase cytochrome b subunit